MGLIDTLIPLAAVILGWWLHRLSTTEQARLQVSAAKAAEHAATFLGQGYTNLRYILQHKDLREQAQPLGDFTVQGHLAALFFSDEVAAAIDRVTSAYARARVNIEAAEEVGPVIEQDSYKTMKLELDRTMQLIKTELGTRRVKVPRRIRLPWPR